MSVEVERIKNLINNDLLVDAVELPTRHKARPSVTDEIEDVLSRFDDDGEYAHFVIRVRRSTKPLPRPSEDPQPPQLSIDSMVNETLELTEKNAQESTEAVLSNASAAEAQPDRQMQVQVNDAPDYDPDFLITNAKLLEDNKEYELARNIYSALVRKGLMIPNGLVGIARTHEKEGQNDKAIRCYREAIAYSSEFPFYQSLAALQIRIGDDEEAAQTLLHSLGLTGLSKDQIFELHKSLGNCYTRLGDYNKAEHHYKKAYELNHDSDALQVNVGSLALQKSDYTSAQEHFERALALNDKNDKAISGLGMVCLGRCEIQKAHDHFVASLKINLANLGSIYNLVKCAYELKKFDDAADILKAHIDSNPVNTNILYSYAGILYHQGQLAAAQEEVTKVLNTNPNHTGATELKELIAARFSRDSQVSQV